MAKEIKVKKGTFTGITKKYTMSDTCLIKEGNFRFEKDGLKITGNSPGKEARSSVWLKKSAFKEYEELGNVGLDDLDTVIKVMNRFGEIVTIKVEGNLATLKSENKSVDIETVAEDYIKTDTGEPTLEFVDTFEITATRLKDIMADAQLNSDAEIRIETTDKKVTFSNTGKYKFKNEIEALICKGGASSRFGKAFIDAVKYLDGNLEISVGNTFPIRVVERTETSVVTIIVAPLADN